MAAITLLVQGDEKLKARELEIISKLMGKKFEIELDDSDLKTDDSIVNYKRVEALILKEIQGGATALRLAKLKLEKVTSIKKLGPVEVTVSGATGKPFKTRVELVGPKKSDPTQRTDYKPPKEEKDPKAGKGEKSEKSESKVPKAPPKKQPPTRFGQMYLGVTKKHKEGPNPKLGMAFLKFDKNKDALKTKGLLNVVSKLLLLEQKNGKVRFDGETDKEKKLALSKYLFDLRKLGQMVAKYQKEYLKKAARPTG